MTAMANKLFIKELTLFLEKGSVVWMINDAKCPRKLTICICMTIPGWSLSSPCLVVMPAVVAVHSHLCVNAKIGNIWNLIKDPQAARLLGLDYDDMPSSI